MFSTSLDRLQRQRDSYIVITIEQIIDYVLCYNIDGESSGPTFTASQAVQISHKEKLMKANIRFTSVTAV